jgi:hypothetical protein
VPIQPNKGEKETLFEVMYHVSYNGKFTFSPQLLMPADNLVVYLAKGIAFKAGSGAQFETRQEDPRVDTWVAKNIHPGQSVSFSISGEGQMPVQSADAQGAMGGSAEAGSRPGGGIGAPIGSPDPLTKYKWWIISGLALLLIGAATFLLRKGEAAAGTAQAPASPSTIPATSTTSRSAAVAPDPSLNNAAVLNNLKDELFAIESERLSGIISEAEYLQIKTGLEAVLRRALSHDK